jgi:hypothetical protein
MFLWFQISNSMIILTKDSLLNRNSCPKRLTNLAQCLVEFILVVASQQACNATGTYVPAVTYCLARCHSSGSQLFSILGCEWEGRCPRWTWEPTRPDPVSTEALILPTDPINAASRYRRVSGSGFSRRSVHNPVLWVMTPCSLVGE